MSAQLQPPARPEAPAGIVPASLDQQIMAAEMAIIAREQRLRLQASRIGEQIHQKLPALGAGAASMVGGVVLRRIFRQRRGVADTGGAVSTGTSWLAQLPWAQLSAFIWPLLPLTVRNRVNPKLVAGLMATAVPLAVAHFKVARQAPVSTAPLLDLRRYAGRWYEIARLPLRTEDQCDSDVTATYTLLRGGRVRVVNSCYTRDGVQEEVRGIARATEGDGAKLEVSFAPRALRWLPGSWAPYWVLHVDPDYGAAVVGTPDRKHLWLLSRSPLMDDSQLQRLLLHARAQGFDTTKLMRTPQGLHAS
ncbi:lipocalin family protein [Azohydromonas australica]|uniref:lipocalin family protein n=1 Tax=Azohydromonas australica TaxID=364039 RepID=UPI000414EF22|nr:lipocalin family protein [Azohydromonas australica]